VRIDGRWPHGVLAVALAVAFGVCAYAGGQARSGLAPSAPKPGSSRIAAQGRQVRPADATQVKLKKIESSAKSGRAAVRGPSANSGQVIQIAGSGFGDEVSVEFLGFAGSTFTLRPTKVKMNKLTLSVPPEVVTGDVRLIDPAAGASNAAKLQIVPTIATFTPVEIAPGGRLLIDGSGFGRDTQVYFQGVRDPVVPTIVSPSRIDIVVPQGARSGKVTVRTFGGRSAAKKLVVASIRAGVPRAIPAHKP
jgi:hypothetical protein